MKDGGRGKEARQENIHFGAKREGKSEVTVLLHLLLVIWMEPLLTLQCRQLVSFVSTVCLLCLMEGH